ncbi:MAG: MBL fold metallo-hydrolase [Candidatus Cloacimonetes bacterium]|nr:MBL fold metallo-hydrolase [Candidatus Cloacimonadota bacterium]
MLKRFEIADDVTLCQAEGSLVNSTIIEAGDELVVIDTLLRPRDTREVAAFIATLDKPVRWLINTHWHSDHCYGNRFLADSRTCVVAHADHMQTLSRERHVLSPERPAIVERKHLVRPHLTFTCELAIERPLPLRLIPASGHTPDSTVIYLPQSKLLIAGDTLLNSDDGRIVVPYFYWGDSLEYIHTLQNLLTLDIDMIIPGHGAACGIEVIERGLRYLHRLRRLTDEYFASHDHDWQAFDMKDSSILVSQCLPGTAEDDFWAPQMHELNLQRSLLEYIRKDDE